jgi:methanogenic corrinoid protein MtbC1
MARDCTAAWFDRNPSYSPPMGQEMARRLTFADFTSHLRFLGGAATAGSLSAYIEYARWTVRLLAARRLDRGIIRASYGLLREFLPVRCPAETVLFFQPYLDAALEAIEDPGAETPAAAPAADPVWSAWQAGMAEALLAADRERAWNIAQAAFTAGHDVIRIYLKLLQEPLYEVGRAWERREITAAEEHIATALAQTIMTRLFDRSPKTSQQRGRLLLTGVEGERHFLGGTMLAQVCELEGWEVRYLGTDLPMDGILKVARDFQPQWAGISTTILFNLPAAVRLVAALRRLEAPPKVLIGGAAFRHAPDLWQECGASAFAANAETALAALRDN